MPLLHPFLLSVLMLCSFLLPTSLWALEQPQKTVTLLLEHTEPSTWTELLLAGLKRAEHDFPLHGEIIIEEDEEKQESVLRKAAERSDLVLVATDRFHEILRNNAARFPNVAFGCIDAGIRGKNISCISFADEQAAYLAGAAAALLVKAKGPHEQAAIGWLSGEDIAAMRSMFHGFEEGAKLAFPSIRVIHGVAGSFSNPAYAALETKRLLSEGVSVLVLGAGASNSGALKEAQKAGITIIGLDSDQKNLYPGHVLLSILKNVDHAVYSLISDYMHGQFKAKEIQIYTLEGGVSVTDPIRSLGRKDATLIHIQRRIQELTQELKKGAIRLKSLRARTLCDCL